jgi:CheY-like chemotaxis protein
MNGQKFRSERLSPCTDIAAAFQKNRIESLSGASPVLAANTMPGAAFERAETRGGAETILLVEDEPFVRQVTAEVLASAGYQLVIAGSADEALAGHRTSCQPIDLLLADVVLPGMSGCELADEFEGCCPQARILLMSGHAEQLAWRELSRHGQKCLAKPFSIQMLLNRVRAVLDADPFDLEPLSIPR